MVHASLLYDYPTELIARYSRLPRRQPLYREGRPHEGFLTNLPLSRLDILAALRVAWPGESNGFEPPIGLAARLVGRKIRPRGLDRAAIAVESREVIDLGHATPSVSPPCVYT